MLMNVYELLKVQDFSFKFKLNLLLSSWLMSIYIKKKGKEKSLNNANANKFQ